MRVFIYGPRNIGVNNFLDDVRVDGQHLLIVYFKRLDVVLDQLIEGGEILRRVKLLPSDDVGDDFMKVQQVFVALVKLLLFQLLVIAGKEEVDENPIKEQELCDYVVHLLLACGGELLFDHQLDNFAHQPDPKRHLVHALEQREKKFIHKTHHYLQVFGLNILCLVLDVDINVILRGLGIHLRPEAPLLCGLILVAALNCALVAAVDFIHHEPAKIHVLVIRFHPDAVPLVRIQPFLDLDLFCEIER